MTAMAKLMVVEDELLIAEHLRSSLVGLGYEVVGVAADFEQAVKLAELGPDLAVLDIQIQGTRDGIETASHLQRHSEVSVLFLTAHADRDTLDRAKALEPLAYLVKPFTDRMLAVSVECALQRRQMDQKRTHQYDVMSSALDHVRNGLLVADEFGILKMANRAAERLLSPQSSIGLAGRPLGDVVPLEAVHRVQLEQWIASEDWTHFSAPLTIGGVTLEVARTITSKGTRVLVGSIRVDSSRTVEFRHEPWLGRRTSTGEPLITVCAACHRAQEAADEFVPLDRYLVHRLSLSFSHTLCPACLATWEAAGDL